MRHCGHRLHSDCHAILVNLKGASRCPQCRMDKRGCIQQWAPWTSPLGCGRQCSRDRWQNG
eukprot:704506-Lingulodinium_polyedra.AAC.1